jgi:1,2-diacylglycerol 3-alpha-glucosyltransferase
MSSPSFSRSARPRHIGIINDYVRIPYANGSSFASQFLYREFTRRGHDVTVLGPRDPLAVKAELPQRAVLFDSLALKNHPGLFLAFPSRRALASTAELGLDLTLAQTGSGLLDLGLWLRQVHAVPLLCVNTIHLPSVYNTLLPDSWHQNRELSAVLERHAIPKLERVTVQAYNESDGLIVLSRGLERYWRERGVTVPIHVIPRAVNPAISERRRGADPFSPRAARGQRLLCVCRHTREKNVQRLIEIFAQLIAPAAPLASLTLVGDGPEFDAFRRVAERAGVADRVVFTGELPVGEVNDYYRHADLFVYTSLSETYGQVVGEALWCGLPVVAFADGMGVSHQLEHSPAGRLIDPAGDVARANRRFAAGVLGWLGNAAERQALGRLGAERARLETDPDACVREYYGAFASARAHLADKPPREGAPPPSVLSLARWTTLHAALAAVGRVRKPALLNRHGRRQPGWEELSEANRLGRQTDAAAFLHARTKLLRESHQFASRGAGVADERKRVA